MTLSLLAGILLCGHVPAVLASTEGGLTPLVSAPGVSDSPLAGAYNPAAWPISGRSGLYLGFDDYIRAGRESERQVFHGALSFGHLGFAVTRNALSGLDVDHYDYVLGAGFGNRSAAAGISYAWTRGAEAVFGESDRITVGSIHRIRFLSLGVRRTWERGPGSDYFQADVGVRPFGPRLTMFADAVKFDDEGREGFTPGFGAEVHVLPGLSAGFRFQPDYHGKPRRVLDGGPSAATQDQWSFRLELSPAPGVRGSVREHLSDGDEVGRSYAVEFREGPDIGQWFFPTRIYPTIELNGPVVYRNYRFLDDRTRFVELLDRVARYAEDPGVEGVVVQMSGLGLSASGLWELRAQLAAARERGKKVVLQFDRLGLIQYVFATVADEIWMDPQGDLDLRGVHFGRTYYRRTLEKAGVGFDELRFFTYKSAMETFSRTSLSDADREQLGALLDDFYEEAVAQVASSRGIQRAQWDEIVNERRMVFAEEALDLGLVDRIGTFEEAKKAAPEAPRRDSSADAIATLGSLHGDFVWSAEEWGEPARIALFYATGVCAMDSGIRGRQLSKEIRRAREDRRIRAVVLRVDSPGGDPLPSDLVARELRETARTKPVIISQGQVAASGGYWISMYGDEILVSPFTVTGSIGVILAHVWDDSLGTRLGWDYDGISRGRSADIQRGPDVPLVGSIPHRPMTAEERARAEVLIRQLYGDFVSSVAEGREMDESAVDAVGQGRVWSGRGGIATGLADRVGGLWDALALAKERARIAGNRAVQIEEGPGLGFVRPDLLMPKLLGVRGAGGSMLGNPRSWASSLAKLVRPDAADGIESMEAIPGTGSSQVSGLATRLGSDLWFQLALSEREHLRFLETHLGQPLVLAPPILIDGNGAEGP